MHQIQRITQLVWSEPAIRVLFHHCLALSSLLSEKRDSGLYSRSKKVSLIQWLLSVLHKKKRVWPAGLSCACSSGWTNWPEALYIIWKCVGFVCCHIISIPNRKSLLGQAGLWSGLCCPGKERTAFSAAFERTLKMGQPSCAAAVTQTECLKGAR